MNAKIIDNRAKPINIWTIITEIAYDLSSFIFKAPFVKSYSVFAGITLI